MEHVETKTTILLSKSLYGKLKRLSKLTKKSMGQLLRDAAEKEYFSAPSRDQKGEIVRRMSEMKVPVGTPEDIEAEILKGRLGF